jgi:hypothetical protein
LLEAVAGIYLLNPYFVQRHFDLPASHRLSSRLNKPAYQAQPKLENHHNSSSRSLRAYKLTSRCAHLSTGTPASKIAMELRLSGAILHKRIS